MSAPQSGAAAAAAREQGQGRCPVCGGAGRHAFTATDRNRRISDEPFAYERCESCATVFLATPPADPGRYYGAGYHPFGADGEPAWKADPALLAAERWRAQKLHALAGGGRLVDIGAGAGGFAAAAAEAGFAVTAIEMDRECCEWMERRLGVSAICTDRPLDALAGLPPSRVVTIWHALEHLPDTAGVLAAAAAALEAGGLLALAIPNSDSLQFRTLRARWAHLDAPRHVSLPGADALLTAARRVGLTPVFETTSDPSALACNLHGWVYALRRDPSQGAAKGLPLRAGSWLTAALGPVEHRARNGAALTLVLRKTA